VGGCTSPRDVDSYPVTVEAKKIFEQALALPAPQRAELIDALAESIVSDDDDDLGPDWQAEIARRIEAVERGESRLIPGDEVEARLRAMLGRV
jgi:putative addiction module component (TIGR02574 family)